MRLRTVIWLAAVALLAIVAVSVFVGARYGASPAVVVVPSGADAEAVKGETGFDWELFALVLTGIGTTTLAIMTGALAFSTWSDVRASQQSAAAAEASLGMARAELTMRPRLDLAADDEGVYSFA